jgi:hypothetical protein
LKILRYRQGRKNSDLCPYWWNEGQGTSKFNQRKIKKLKEKKKIQEFFMFNLTLKFYTFFFVNIDFASHALAKSKGSKHPTPRS